VGPNREELRTSFDRSAELYQRVRPDYPDGLFDRLLAVTGLQAGDEVLEVGAGPGKATLPLARRGLKITALEPGPGLAVQARKNLGGYPVDVVQMRFEDWKAPPGRYAAVIAATAWHWVDPAVGYQLAAAALRPAGYLATWGAGHVFPVGGDPFFEEIQQVYDAIGESTPGDAVRPAPGELLDQRRRFTRLGSSM
jgi:SAM-dependent methyltransferase